MSSGELTCLEFVELITDYLEGVLERSSASRVTEHLVRCEWCMRYLDQMNATVAALKMLPPEPVPGALCVAIAAAALDSGASSNGHCDL